jgi:hypothetical protein
MMPTNEGHVAIATPSFGKVSGITDILKSKKKMHGNHLPDMPLMILLKGFKGEDLQENRFNWSIEDNRDPMMGIEKLKRPAGQKRPKG